MHIGNGTPGFPCTCKERLFLGMVAGIGGVQCTVCLVLFCCILMSRQAGQRGEWNA